MSRDPNEPKLIGPDKMPTDPKKLHKYLYANGDPVNGWDPTGREEADYDMLTYKTALNAYRLIKVYKLLDAYAVCSGTLWELWLSENPGASLDTEWAAYQGCVAALAWGFGY